LNTNHINFFCREF